MESKTLVLLKDTLGNNVIRSSAIAEYVYIMNGSQVAFNALQKDNICLIVISNPSDMVPDEIVRAVEHLSNMGLQYIWSIVVNTDGWFTDEQQGILQAIYDRAPQIIPFDTPNTDMNIRGMTDMLKYISKPLYLTQPENLAASAPPQDPEDPKDPDDLEALELAVKESLTISGVTSRLQEDKSGWNKPQTVTYELRDSTPGFLTLYKNGEVSETKNGHVWFGETNSVIIMFGSDSLAKGPYGELIERLYRLPGNNKNALQQASIKCTNGYSIALFGYECRVYEDEKLVERLPSEVGAALFLQLVSKLPISSMQIAKQA